MPPPLLFTSAVLQSFISCVNGLAFVFYGELNTEIKHESPSNDTPSLMPFLFMPFLFTSLLHLQTRRCLTL
jgi:hypothetical protein